MDYAIQLNAEAIALREAIIRLEMKKDEEALFEVPKCYIPEDFFDEEVPHVPEGFFEDVPAFVPEDFFETDAEKKQRTVSSLHQASSIHSSDAISGLIAEFENNEEILQAI
jgi:hypothetical protein